MQTLLINTSPVEILSDLLYQTIQKFILNPEILYTSFKKNRLILKIIKYK